MEQGHAIGWLGWSAVAFAAFAAGILLVHLLRRGPIDGAAKLWLLMGLGVFPIASAATTNVAGFQATQSRAFCGSCHVMTPHATDSMDKASRTMSAIHARNKYFGNDNCYTCHKDYGMYGYVLTKMGGMRHVYLYLSEYRSMPLDRSRHEIRIMRPIANSTCMSCHTTEAPRWAALGDHASSLAGLRDGSVSCASPGCHGFSHPNTKLGKELLPDGGARP